jgi:hypothetical protein
MEPVCGCDGCGHCNSIRTPISISEIKELPITNENSVIWNRGKFKEKKHFLYGPEGYNPSIMSHYHLEQLKLYKAWVCLLSQ